MDVPGRDIDALVDAFTRTSDPEEIAKEIGSTPELVRAMLDDPDVGIKAMHRKRASLGVVFAGQIMDRLVNIAITASPTTAMQAVRVLEGYVTPAKVGRPSTKEPEGPAYEETLEQLQ